MAEKAYRGNTRPIYKGKDYTGSVINNWKILGPIDCVRGRGKNYHTKWLCQCLCGSEAKWVDKYNLTKGLTAGCSDCYTERHSGSNNPNWKGYKEIPSSLVNHIKYGAKSRGIKYSLSNKYLNDLWVKSKGKCALSGMDIDISKSASLDRIDSLKGYISGNVQWVHKNVNIMKREIPQKEFIKICRAISVNHID